MGHRHVGTEHLLIGILRVETSLAAQILIARGLEAGPIQEQMAKDHEVDSFLRTEFSQSDALPQGLLRRRKRIRTRAISGASPTLDSFLAGLSRLKSEDLIDFFAQNAECIDASGKRWNREEIFRGFDTLFAHYAKKTRVTWSRRRWWKPANCLSLRSFGRTPCWRAKSVSGCTE